MKRIARYFFYAIGYVHGGKYRGNANVHDDVLYYKTNLAQEGNIHFHDMDTINLMAMIINSHWRMLNCKIRIYGTDGPYLQIAATAFARKKIKEN
ncbi:hypothetical protein NQ317_019878 [Molorchus minor]|uniref:Uncharacterized protein n=1 Tax=Molorchus minor TaxID=1323400 RepID=A0ABQ9J947_9CUCU|nr:hypothetical protein NQ317_019878 [Molorchus minor]